MWFIRGNVSFTLKHTYHRISFWQSLYICSEPFWWTIGAQTVSVNIELGFAVYFGDWNSQNFSEFSNCTYIGRECHGILTLDNTVRRPDNWPLQICQLAGKVSMILSGVRHLSRDHKPLFEYACQRSNMKLSLASLCDLMAASNLRLIAPKLQLIDIVGKINFQPYIRSVSQVGAFCSCSNEFVLLSRWESEAMKPPSRQASVIASITMQGILSPMSMAEGPQKQQLMASPLKLIPKVFSFFCQSHMCTWLPSWQSATSPHFFSKPAMQ